MNWTNLSVSFEAKYWVSRQGSDIYQTWRRAIKTALYSSFCAMNRRLKIVVEKRISAVSPREILWQRAARIHFASPSDLLFVVPLSLLSFSFSSVPSLVAPACNKSDACVSECRTSAATTKNAPGTEDAETEILRQRRPILNSDWLPSLYQEYRRMDGERNDHSMQGIHKIGPLPAPP